MGEMEKIKEVVRRYREDRIREIEFLAYLLDVIKNLYDKCILGFDEYNRIKRDIEEKIVAELKLLLRDLGVEYE